MVVACRRWVRIGISGIQIAVGWRGVVGARGWPWFCSPSSRSPSLRIGDFWLNGGVLVVVARRGWVQIGTSRIQIVVGLWVWIWVQIGTSGIQKMDLFWVFFFFFGFVGMDLVVVDVDGGSGGGNGSGWFGF